MATKSPLAAVGHDCGSGKPVAESYRNGPGRTLPHDIARTYLPVASDGRWTLGGRCGEGSAHRELVRVVGDGLRGRIVIRKALSADHEVTVAETNRRGHATRLAQNAATEGIDVVAVLGGDGTLNEAANGLAGSQTALAPLPGGSTNVFARTIGLPNDPIEATGALLDALASNSIERIGMGSVNGRYFLFHTGVGYDAEVVAQVERRSQLKRYAGHPLFVWAAVTTWFRHYDHSRPRFAIELGSGSEREVVDDGYFLVVLNTSPYTFLGNRPLDIAPHATLESRLSAVAIRSLTLPTILRWRRCSPW